MYSCIVLCICGYGFTHSARIAISNKPTPMVRTA
jgi:hypothetical protein